MIERPCVYIVCEDDFEDCIVLTVHRTLEGPRAGFSTERSAGNDRATSE
jgi:hypothetical protein